MSRRSLIYCPPPGSYCQNYRKYLEDTCPALLPWQEFLVNWYTRLRERCPDRGWTRSGDDEKTSAFSPRI